MPFFCQVGVNSRFPADTREGQDSLLAGGGAACSFLFGLLWHHPGRGAGPGVITFIENRRLDSPLSLGMVVFG